MFRGKFIGKLSCVYLVTFVLHPRPPGQSPSLIESFYANNCYNVINNVFTQQNTVNADFMNEHSLTNLLKSILFADFLTIG